MLADVRANRLLARDAARPRRARARPRARRRCVETSSGSTGTTQSPSSSNAPALTDKTTTPSRVVHERRLLRDEVEPVHDRVHEQDVELLVRGDRRREVVGDRAAVSAPGNAASTAAAAASIRRAPRRTRGCPGARRRAARACRRGRAGRAGARAAARTPRSPRGDVLRRIGAVDAEDQPLGPRGHELALPREHRRRSARARRTRPGRSRSDARSRAARPARARGRGRSRGRRAASAGCGSRRRRTRAAPRGSARTIGSGSTDQPSAPTQGMWVKCASAASGRRSRTSAGAT